MGRKKKRFYKSIRPCFSRHTESPGALLALGLVFSPGLCRDSPRELLIQQPGNRLTVRSQTGSWGPSRPLSNHASTANQTASIKIAPPVVKRIQSRCRQKSTSLVAMAIKVEDSMNSIGTKV